MRLLQSQVVSDALSLDSSSKGNDAATSYELHEFPGRWLRRWPRFNRGITVPQSEWDWDG